MIYFCRYCAIRTSCSKSGIGRHERHCHSNVDRIENNQGRKGEKRKPHSEETKKLLSLKATGRAKTEIAEKERIRKISEKAKLYNGGYRVGSGRGKKGWYNGIFCDSSWELAYIIYCTDHNIPITRNLEKRQYEYNGQILNYIPDFVVDGKLVEIKGYKTEQWMAKYKANNDIIVLYETDMHCIIKYVTDTYGKNFVRFYDGR